MIEAFDLIENTSVRNEFQLAFEKLGRIELIQLLSDLKYLPMKAFDDGKVDDAEMANAIARFRAEYQDALELPEASNLDDIRQASEAIEFEEPSIHELTRRENFVLKEIVGLANELEIYELSIGECNLLSRVIIYRYRVYDLIRVVMPNHRITFDVVQKLEQAAKDIGYTKGWLTLGNLLANQEGLSSFCLSSKVLSNNIFGHCIFIELTSKEGKGLIEDLGSNIRARRRFVNALTTAGAQRVINDLTAPHNLQAATTQVNSYLDTSIANKFMRRILQVKLWTMGLYQGRLDHDFGPLSTEALVEYLYTITDREATGKEELGRILYNLGNNQCIISIRHLLTQHFIPVETAEIHEDHSSVSQIFDFVMEDKTPVKSIKRNKRKKIEKESAKLKETLETDLRKESKIILDDTKANVRQYKARRGIMKFFTKLFKFVKNAFTKILKLIQKLFRLVKKSIKIIYTEIKDAFQHFRAGLEFLFGKRVINPTSTITSDYDFDYDGVTIIHSTPSTEDLQEHTNTMKRYAAGVYSTLNFVRIVIKWGLRLASGPIGWVKILVGIARLFRQMLRNRRTSALQIA